MANGVFVTRDLVSEPPNVLNPAEMANRCKKLTELGLKVEVLGPREMTKLGFGALLGVAQGSVNEPRMVVMHWNGASGDAGVRKDKPLAFIGKGVTFDTGGISIKPAGGMEDMKWDMAGAGTVIGLMAALAGRKAKVDAVGLVGLVENMPSGSAQRPGDVVKSYSGQTIEVINTDAEGRSGAGRCALVLPAEIRSEVHDRPGDADRRDHHLRSVTNMPECSATMTSWRRSWVRSAARRARRSGACRWTTHTTS